MVVFCSVTAQGYTSKSGRPGSHLHPHLWSKDWTTPPVRTLTLQQTRGFLSRPIKTAGKWMNYYMRDGQPANYNYFLLFWFNLFFLLPFICDTCNKNWKETNVQSKNKWLPNNKKDHPPNDDPQTATPGFRLDYEVIRTFGWHFQVATSGWSNGSWTKKWGVTNHCRSCLRFYNVSILFETSI